MGAVLPMTGLAVLLATFDGAVLTLALAAIARDFHASVQDLSRLGALLAFGSLGSLPLAWLADRQGRRGIIALGVAGFGAANLVSALAPSLLVLAIVRFAAVCFESLVLSVSTALVVEETPGPYRGQAVAAITILAGAGSFLTILAYPLLAPHWRVLYVAGGIALPAAALVWRFLPEGSRWAAAEVRRSGLEVLLEAPWRRLLLVLLAASLLVAVLLQPAGFFVAFFGSTSLGLRPLSISGVVFVAGALSIPAFVLGGRLSDRFGRRGPAVVLTAATAAGVVLTFTGSVGGYVAGNALWSVLASAAVPVLGAWIGELFPTRARATSQALAALAQAGGGALGLLAVGVLSASLGLGWALLTVAAGALLGAGLLWLLPETSGEPLSD